MGLEGVRSFMVGSKKWNRKAAHIINATNKIIANIVFMRSVEKNDMLRFRPFFDFLRFLFLGGILEVAAVVMTCCYKI